MDLALFSALSPAERQQVAMLAGKRTYQKGEIVFYEGQSEDTIYLFLTALFTPNKIYPLNGQAKRLYKGFILF